MFMVSKNGGAIVRPLFFDFSDDDNTLNDMESTFMLGESLMVAPLLKDATAYTVYFPRGKWVNINNHKDIIDVGAQGSSATLKPFQTYTNVYLKEGRIVPYQQNKKLVKTTSDFRS